MASIFLCRDAASNPPIFHWLVTVLTYKHPLFKVLCDMLAWNWEGVCKWNDALRKSVMETIDYQTRSFSHHTESCGWSHASVCTIHNFRQGKRMVLLDRIGGNLGVPCHEESSILGPRLSTPSLVPPHTYVQGPGSQAPPVLLPWQCSHVTPHNSGI